MNATTRLIGIMIGASTLSPVWASGKLGEPVRLLNKDGQDGLELIITADGKGDLTFTVEHPFSKREGLVKSHQLKKLTDALEKGKRWLQTAKESKLNVEKQIVEIGNGDNPFMPSGVELILVSENNGEKAFVRLNVFSHSLQISTYLDEKLIEDLISIVKSGPEESKRANDLLK